MARIELKLPPVPSELKTITPFISRAQELSGKEPIIAYYCLYHATQTGIDVSKGKDPDGFLSTLMTALEAMKGQLKDREEVNGDQAAAKYIEVFALKVFNNADNEDRKGGSNRSTAKKFLAASNFFELLSIFDTKYLNPLIQPEEKIKYAKWKAADIAKAYREGRIPQSGPETTLGVSEGELAEIQTLSRFEIGDASMGSYFNAAATFDDSKSQHTQESGAITPPVESPALKPSVESSLPTTTATLNKNPTGFLTPKHISTASAAPYHYVVDFSSPTTSGPKTPLKSPVVSDGLWSTAATPGIDSPNMFPGGVGGSGVRTPISHLNPPSIALFNATLGGTKGVGGDSPLSPGASPKSRSGLGASVVTASGLGSLGASRKQEGEDGIDTDEEDGQWSTAGNDPFSRQNSMVPLSSSTSLSSGHPPGLVVTSSLGVLQEEVFPQSTPQKQVGNSENQTKDHQNLVAPGALAVPLPPSVTNTVPSPPESRPNSVTFAASHPLPPVLPPSTQTPSSVKSDSHVLPIGDSPNKNYKYTSSVVGDSMSDGEIGHNIRRRANSVSSPPPNTKLSAEDRSSLHVRSSSVNTASILASATQASTNGRDATPHRGNRSEASSSADDEWEKSSLSRLRELGSPQSESITPTFSNDGNSDHKSRRNTIRANAPLHDARLSGSHFGFTLPGVPSAPPIDSWDHSRRGGDSGGEGDMKEGLPSVPAVPPIVQDRLPHVSVFPKPMTPKEELHVNPNLSASTSTSFPTAPPQDLESPSTPRTQVPPHTIPTAPTSVQHAPTMASLPPPPPPPPLYGYQQSLPPLVAASNTGQSPHHVYMSPNPVTSPHGNIMVNMVPVPTQFTPQLVPAAAPTGANHPIPPSYLTGGQMNGFTDAFGVPINTRPLPTEVEPETLSKAQKHTKLALSALDFEDLETARNELKKALLLLS